MVVNTLDDTVFGLPNFHKAVLGTRDYPLSFAMKLNPGDVGSVTGEHHDGLGIGRPCVKQFDIVIASSRKEPFVGRDAETIDL